jgi:hypothetical protein
MGPRYVGCLKEGQKQCDFTFWSPISKLFSVLVQISETNFNLGLKNQTLTIILLSRFSRFKNRGSSFKNLIIFETPPWNTSLAFFVCWRSFVWAASYPMLLGAE